MKTEAQRLYEEANKLQYSKGGLAQALDLYKQVIADYPESPQAEYSQNQISHIQGASATQTGHAAQKVEPYSTQSLSGASSTLKVFAWLALIGGLIGGFLIIATLKPMLGAMLAAIIGGAIALQSALGWAFLMVVAEMADNLVKIKKNTSTAP